MLTWPALWEEISVKFEQNAAIYIQERHPKTFALKYWLFCLGFNVTSSWRLYLSNRPQSDQSASSIAMQLIINYEWDGK